MPDVSIAPWTAAEVESLNAFQASGVTLPFTCESDDEPCVAVLVATPGGWVCPRCGCTQDWAIRYMTDGSWRQRLPDPSSYSVRINAPLSPAAIEALNERLRSGDVPRRKVWRRRRARPVD